MLSQPVRSIIEGQKPLLASSDITVAEAARLMSEHKAGAVMVVANDRLVGIFTERDAVYRVIAKGLDPEAVHLAEVMTSAPVTVTPDDSFGHALAVMHRHGFRHTPVVVTGRPVGIVSARHALDPDLEEF